VYRWAGNLITDLSEIRIEDGKSGQSGEYDEKEPGAPPSRLAIVSRKAGTAGGD